MVSLIFEGKQLAWRTYLCAVNTSEYKFVAYCKQSVLTNVFFITQMSVPAR